MSKSRPPPAKFTYTDQFVLRPIEPADVVQIYDSVRESLFDLKAFMSWAHHSISENSYLDRVLHQHALYFQNKEYELGMFDQASGDLLVYIGFYPALRLNPDGYEIGFWTRSKFAGKGFATLATKIAIAIIFEYFKGDRIDISHNIENRRSQRVVEKCGFLYEGELRNYYPKPSEEMMKNGMTQERTVYSYALIPEDRKNLEWYSETVKNITVHPLLGEPFKL